MSLQSRHLAMAKLSNEQLRARIESLETACRLAHEFIRARYAASNYAVKALEAAVTDLMVVKR